VAALRGRGAGKGCIGKKSAASRRQKSAARDGKRKREKTYFRKNRRRPPPRESSGEGKHKNVRGRGKEENAHKSWGGGGEVRKGRK